VVTAGTWLQCSWRPSLSFSASSARDSLGFGLHVSFQQVSGYISHNSYLTLIGAHLGAASLGLYSKSYDLFMSPLNQVLSPVGQVLQPVLGHLRDRPKEYRTAVLGALELLMLSVMPIAALMVALPDLVRAVLMGAQWTGATPLLRWFGLAILVHPLPVAALWILISLRRGSALSKVGFTNMAVNVGLLVIALPQGLPTIVLASIMGGLLLRIPLLAYCATRDSPVTLTDLATLLYRNVCLGALLGGAFFAVQPWLAVTVGDSLLVLLVLAAAGYGIVLPFVIFSEGYRQVISLLTKSWNSK
jgi:PST family polysaccharide transporter